MCVILCPSNFLLLYLSIQLLSESQINMVKVVNSVSDALSSMQKETGNIKSRLKADLQRAPVHSVRPKGCAGGEGKKNPH